jgi:hypothetical protein
VPRSDEIQKFAFAVNHLPASRSKCSHTSPPSSSIL